MLALPGKLELLVTIEEVEEPEIHRAHIERSDFGLEDFRRLDALLRRHERTAAGREIDDRVGLLLDARQEAREGFRGLIGFAGFGIARVQMKDRGAGFSGA